MAVATEFRKVEHSFTCTSGRTPSAEAGPTKVQYVNLTATEIEQCRRLIDELFTDAVALPLLEFLQIAPIYAQELPRRIRTAFYHFKLNEKFSALCIRGLPQNPTIGPTPSAHRPPGIVEVVRRPEAIHVLFSSLLGEPFAWTTIQNGYVINDVMPVREHASLISSSGSARSFDLHTEDAFHSCAGEYLGLMCLRNRDRVATVLATVRAQDLNSDNLLALSEARYIVGANIAQLVPTVTHYSPILFGNLQWPYMRVNLNNTIARPGDRQAHSALEELRAALERNSVSVIFAPGDCWYLDNLRTAHGRVPFQPRYDGTDRWLKRIYITGSIRHSASLRSTAASRVLELQQEPTTNEHG